MPFSEELAERVRRLLPPSSDVREQKMFGGLAFMVDGHMTCGVLGEDLMLRLGNEEADRALDEPHVRPMDFTGRPMSTIVFVAPTGVVDHDDLARWVSRALGYVATLPPRTASG